MSGSNACLRLLGRLGGLYPEDPSEAGLVDEVLDVIENDIGIALARASVNVDEAKRMELRKKFAEITLPTYLGHMEARMVGPFVTGEKITVADLKLAQAYRSLAEKVYDGVDGAAFEKCPKIMAAINAVKANEKVAAWEAKHNA